MPITSSNNLEKIAAKTPQAGNISSVNENLTAVNIEVLDASLGGAAKDVYTLMQDTTKLGTVATTAYSTMGAALKLNTVAGSAEYGTINYDPSQAAKVQALAAGETATDTFIYTIRLGNGALSSATVSATLTGVNDIAKIGGAAAGTVTEDGTLTSTGKLTIADPDHDQSSFKAIALADLHKTYGDFTFNTDGTWGYTLNNSAANVQALNTGQTVHDKLTVMSLDGSASQTIDVSINGVNDWVASPHSFSAASLGYNYDYAQVITQHYVYQDGQKYDYTYGNGQTELDGVANVSSPYPYIIADSYTQNLNTQQTRTITEVINNAPVSHLSFTYTEQNSYKEDFRSEAEYNISSVGDHTVQNATLRWVSTNIYTQTGNTVTNDPSTFDVLVKLYAGDGQSTAADYGLGIGSTVAVLKTDASTGQRYYEADLDEALVNQIIAGPGDFLGAKVQVVNHNAAGEYTNASSYTGVTNYDWDPNTGSYTPHATYTDTYQTNGSIGYSFIQGINPTLDLVF